MQFLMGVRRPSPTKSRHHLAGLVLGKDVRVIPRDIDRYRRTVAQIEVGGRDVSMDMIRAGLAWWFERYAPKDTSLRDAEEAAKKARVGLWADPASVAPWRWRVIDDPTQR